MIKANLVNQEGCMFDKGEFETLKQVQEWAMGRGEDYTLNVFEEGKLSWYFEFEDCMEGLYETDNAIGTLFIIL